MAGLGAQRLVRADSLRALDRGRQTTLLGRDGAARVFDEDSSGLVRAALAFLREPRSAQELSAQLSSLAEAPVPEALLTELLAVLMDTGAVVPWRAQEPRTPTPLAGRRVLVAVTGAVASVDAPALVRMLLARGASVRVAMTPSARRFVRPRCFEALTHAAVYKSLWGGAPDAPAPHIALARWAELVLVYPATATTVARIARGDCDELVAACVCATRAPVVVAPSMNDAMATAPAVLRNLEALREDGRWVVHPTLGHEVAEHPSERRGMLGPAPAPQVVIELLEHVLRVSSPPSPRSWEDVWRGTPVEALPWTVATLDEDLVAVLDATARERPGARVLDLGTGAGTVALAAASRGLSVVATDVSSTALDLASRAPFAERVTWLQDDVRQSQLRGAFDLVVDRGCLHLLCPAERDAWRRLVWRLTAPAGLVAAKVHAETETTHGTFPFSRQDLEGFLGGGFVCESVGEGTLPGPDERAPRAYLALWRRAR
ncbi:MAG: methyltransferase domain-containing protein [Deltaproteobacteria bacterium]|nr:methyltransferase domain-containing protein [Deltaproteobacteria bacterium]